MEFHSETADADRRRNPQRNGTAKLESALRKSTRGSPINTTITLGNSDVVPPKVLDAYLTLAEGQYAGLHRLGIAVARHCERRGIPFGLSDMIQLYVDAHH